MFYWTVHLTGEDEDECRYSAVTVGVKVYYFKRSDGDTDTIDVDVFNTVSLRWRKLPPVTSGLAKRHPEVPSSRSDHSAVLDEDVIYLWGGCERYTYELCNILYAFDVDSHRWFKPRVSGSVPEGRSSHSACVLGKVMFIYGGLTQTRYTNDIYKLDTTTIIWSLIKPRGTPPTASCSHTATIIGTKMFVFGGLGGREGEYLSTIRVFDTETNCWRNIKSSAQLLPEGCPTEGGHSAFAYNGELYIFAGDLWKFNPECFSWKKVQPKGKEPGPVHRMCCCMVADRIILFRSGSYDEPKDLFLLDLSPSLKTLCKLAVIQCGLEQSGLTHDIRWELAAMTTNRN